ncbi:WhiB family transcriptional regulator [Nocardiopsis sp. CNT312]|uniref:WhiB family transcriptional regulator n=1 Tax=Nocardiopsis sp. CNT312 TaxID=1137268 RepID=UPI0004B8CFD6|nr:WhiB family transcriptional regulator [Nocardiopsis sp. CNT312]
MHSALTDPSLANCRTVDPDALFVKGTEQTRARRICEGCPVRLDCLAEALDARIEFGVWGGLTERQRRALLRRHPDVARWRPRLLQAPELYTGRTVGCL